MRDDRRDKSLCEFIFLRAKLESNSLFPLKIIIAFTLNIKIIITFAILNAQTPM